MLRTVKTLRVVGSCCQAYFDKSTPTILRVKRVQEGYHLIKLWSRSCRGFARSAIQYSRVGVPGPVLCGQTR